MLRPQEAPFFDCVDEFSWRMIVLDEAHSYRGTQGIELARLMQRIRAAVRRSKIKLGVTYHEPICIATSATLSTEGDEFKRKATTSDFAGKLFGIAMSTEGVLFTDRIDPAQAAVWQFPTPEAAEIADQAWAKFDLKWLDDLDNPIDKFFVGGFDILAPAKEIARARESALSDRRAFLFHLFQGHPRFHWLWRRIEQKPVALYELLDNVPEFGDTEEDRSAGLAAMVRCFHAARRQAGEQSLLPCRYHLFASALEGLFVDLATDEEMKNPKEDWHDPVNGIRQLAVRRIQPALDRDAFELARCLNCGEPFVVVDDMPIRDSLDQPPVWDRPVQFFSFRSVKWDNTLLSAQTVRFAPDTFPRIGASSPDGNQRTLFEVDRDSSGTDVQACPHCNFGAGSKTNVVSRLMTGQDAPVSVLAWSLYQQLPAQTDKKLAGLKAEYADRFAGGGDPQVGGGRKLLVFSDSRQNAAFMAHYLQDAAVTNLLRWAAWHALPDNEAVSLVDWRNHLDRWLADRKILLPFLDDQDYSDPKSTLFRNSYKDDKTDRAKTLLSFLMQEATGFQDRALEGTGLIVVDNDAKHGLRNVADADVSDWPSGGPPLTAAEVRALVSRLVDEMRRRDLVSADRFGGRSARVWSEEGSRHFFGVYARQKRD